MARGEGVHATVRKIDGSMAAMNNTLRRFGTPDEIGNELRGLKESVGDLIAKLHMMERRS